MIATIATMTKLARNGKATKPAARPARVLRTATPAANGVHEADRQPAPMRPPERAVELLRARHVMATLKLTAYELKQWIECGLLTPRYRPNPHRIGRRNAAKSSRAFFHPDEVAAAWSKLNPKV